MKKICHLLILIFFWLQGPAQQTVSVDSLMEYCRSNLRFNGIVLIASKNRIIYQHAFGKSGGKSSYKIGLDTKFRLGSLSKQFTAFIVLQLVEQKSLSLNDHLSKFVAAFDQPDKRDITLSNLLTHTSGLADYTNLNNFNDQVYYPRDSIVNMIAGAPLSFEPSSAFSYSNSNYFLLALVIEKLTGKHFTDLLNEVVLKKAKMENSGEEINQPINNMATGYIDNNDSISEAPFIEMRNTVGGGGIYSTANDLLKWSVFFQDRLAKDSLLKNALRPFGLSDGTQTIYSCGWCFMPGLIFHTGHISGFANLLSIDTVHHQTIIILTNDDYKQLYITMQSLKDIVQNNGFSGWITNKPGNHLEDYNGVYGNGKITVKIKNRSGDLEDSVFGKKGLLKWYANDEFFSMDNELLIKFTRDKEGRVIALQGFANYHWVQLKKTNNLQ